MKVDLLLDPFGATWHQMRDAAVKAEHDGYDGIWTYDHLSGSVHRASHVLECWTILTAIAAVTTRVTIGPMVLNVANRDAGTLGPMIETLQHVSGGRLIVGIGAGGGIGTPYAAEQIERGRPVAPDGMRRRYVEEAIVKLRAQPQPNPLTPIIVGGFGPKMAELAGRVADGINVPAGAGFDELVKTAKEAHEKVGRDPDAFIVTASASLRDRSRLERKVDRLIVYTRVNG